MSQQYRVSRGALGGSAKHLEKAPLLLKLTLRAFSVMGLGVSFRVKLSILQEDEVRTTTPREGVVVMKAAVVKVENDLIQMSTSWGVQENQ